MDAQFKRGMIESGVLALLLRGESYGYQLIREMSALMEISESTLYPVLRRLETAGCLTVSSREHNGRLRKYYAITDQGKRRIEDFLREWREAHKVYQYILSVYGGAENATTEHSIEKREET